MKRNNRGFTLAELLIVIAILVAMATILIGIINPIALIGRAKDARRKSDLNKIKIAFEEYYNDKKTYPTATDINTWNVVGNCGEHIAGIDGYIKNWPCDPDGQVYSMASGPSSFKVVTNLENKLDKDIPTEWYTSEDKYYLVGFTKDTANFGVSSSNILWYETILNDNCNKNLCSMWTGGHCDGGIGSCDLSSNGTCYYSSGCEAGCVWKCCGSGCNEE
ncbi:MAG: prepilin-type N-terminal cleavage/methylation domain-containing protein [Candidatus Shapirobacteria bacterium]|jgi:prepilin-type N-terminal cleavage/methylation domain-containing protein